MCIRDSSEEAGLRKIHLVLPVTADQLLEDAQGGMARRKAEQAAGILPQLPADGIRYC